MTRTETDLLQTLEQRVKSHGEAVLSERDKTEFHRLRGTLPKEEEPNEEEIDA